MNNPILVTGATGKQGGAVVRSLLERGAKVHALVRDASKPAAKELEKLGAKLVVGSFDDKQSLSNAMQGAEGVFSVQNFFEVGFEKEVEQGKAIADLAKQSGVKHLVFGSVIGADRKSGIPHFESKWHIEEHIRSIGISATILRIVAYMDNMFTFNWYKDGRIYLPLRPDAQWQLIATRDIGEFAALAFANPQAIPATLEIAGDQLTPEQLAQTFSRVLNRDVKFEQQPMSELRSYSEELALMFEWFNDRANFADLQSLRKIHPGLLNVEAWLRKQVAEKQLAVR